MTYQGRVERGVIVVDGPSKPPEGAILRIEEVKVRSQPTLADLAGKIDDLPADLSKNHDTYRRQRAS